MTSIHEQYTVAISTFLLCLTLKAKVSPVARRQSSGTAFEDIEWVPLLHALCVSLLAVVAFFMENPDDPEPLHSLRCAGPYSRLHAVLPMISAGYSAFEVVEALRSGSKSYVLHGSFIFFFLVLGAAAGFVHNFTRVQLCEISTIFLNSQRLRVRRSLQILNAAIFVFAFFSVRLIAMPMWSLQWLSTFMVEGSDCLPSFIGKVYFAANGLFFALNIWWARAIIKKIERTWKKQS